MSVFARVRAWARQIKAEVYILAVACRDPRTPWYAKVLAACVVAYAFSPIDLIPDFVPVLGYLDDVILVPLGVLLVRRLIPATVLADSRTEAERMRAAGKPANRAAAIVIVIVWLVALAVAAKVGATMFFGDRFG